MAFEDLTHRAQAWLDSIPGFVGYRDRERRRDADKQVRVHLARQLDAQRSRLADIQNQIVRSSKLDLIAEVERVVQKLQLLIDRLRTASYGYAGWYQAPVIQASDLDQLLAFDQALASGVDQVRAGIDALAGVLSDKPQAQVAIDGLARTLDTLNTRFDQRRDLLEKGKRLPAAELASVLQAKTTPAEAQPALARLKLGDALEVEGVDYLTTAQATYRTDKATWTAFRLQEQPERWLRVADPQIGALALFEAVAVAVARPPEAPLTVGGETFDQVAQSSATMDVTGPGGVRHGAIQAWYFRSESGTWLLIEDWGDAVRTGRGQVIDPDLVKVYPKK